MLEQYSISIEQLMHHYNIGVGLDKNFLITNQIVESAKVLDFPCRVSAFIMGICQKGELSLTVNFKAWDITENTCFVSIPENIIGLEKLSDDFEGYVIVVSMDYIKHINLDITKMLPYYMSIRINPCFRIDEEDAAGVIRFFDMAEWSLNDKHTHWKDEIIKGAISVLIYRVFGIMEQYEQKMKKPKNKSKEYYFLKFIELCAKQYQLHHDIGYYADEIYLTPKYLSAVVKEVSGLSAAVWIEEYIINDAKIQLTFSEKNIQQISDSLNFPNQSLFGRYFKQRVGMSPSQYKMDNATSI